MATNEVDDIVAALNRAAASADGVVMTMDYEPVNITDAPLVYTVIDGFDTSDYASFVNISYRFRMTILVLAQDDAEAERTMRSLIVSVPTAVRRAEWAGTIPHARLVTVKSASNRELSFSAKVPCLFIDLNIEVQVTKPGRGG